MIPEEPTGVSLRVILLVLSGKSEHKAAWDRCQIWAWRPMVGALSRWSAGMAAKRDHWLSGTAIDGTCHPIGPPASIKVVKMGLC